MNKLLEHSLHFASRYIGLMGSEPTSKRTGNMHQLVNQYPGLLIAAEPVKFFGDNLDDIMGLPVESQLHNPRKPMTTGNGSFALGAFTPDANDSGVVQVGHSKLMDNLLYPPEDVLGMFIMNHKPSHAQSGGK